jgi:preprotein translocase subunit SecF
MKPRYGNKRFTEKSGIHVRKNFNKLSTTKMTTKTKATATTATTTTTTTTITTSITTNININILFKFGQNISVELVRYFFLKKCAARVT